MGGFCDPPPWLSSCHPRCSRVLAGVVFGFCALQPAEMEAGVSEGDDEDEEAGEVVSEEEALLRQKCALEEAQNSEFLSALRAGKAKTVIRFGSEVRRPPQLPEPPLFLMSRPLALV